MIEIWMINPFKITKNTCFSNKYCVLVTELNEFLWNFNKTKSDYESYTYVYNTYIYKSDYKKMFRNYNFKHYQKYDR